MACMGKWNHGADRCEDSFDHAGGRVNTSRSQEFPDFVEVIERLRVEGIPVVARTISADGRQRSGCGSGFRRPRRILPSADHS